jgi:outer membrane protein TolC
MLRTLLRAVPTHGRRLFPILILAIAAPDAGAQAATPVHEVVREALAGNPEIRAAARERDAARERIAPAGALDDPMLEAGLLSVPTNSWRLDREDMTMRMIGLAQKLPYPGKRGLRRDVAARDAESAEHAYRETVNRVAREARIGYLDLALALETARLTERNLRLLEQFAGIAEARYGVGQGAQSDVLKARSQVSRMREELIRLAREREGLEAELNRALGRAPGAAAPLPEALRLQPAPPPLDALREAALGQRPQLLALQSLVARSEHALALARLESRPDFDVRLSYGQRDNMPDGGRRPDLLSLTVAINLPVWRESRTTPRVSEALSRREQAISLHEAQRNEVLARLRQQAAGAEQNRRSARLYEAEILPQARLAVEAALSAYRVGRGDFMALLDSQMTVYAYELAHAAAVANHNKALAEIDLLVGKAPL